MTERQPVASTGASDLAVLRSLSEATSTEDAVRRLLEIIGTSFGWDSGELWLAEDRDGSLRHAGDWSLPRPELLEFRKVGRRLSFSPGVGLPGRVWAQGEPVWIPDVAVDPNFARAKAAARANVHAAVGLPVRDVTEPLGVLTYFASDVRELDTAQLEAMASAVDRVGVYVARIRAERRLATTERISGSIFEAALDCVVTMDAEGRVLDFNPAAVATFGYDRAEARGRRLAELIVPEEFREAHERALRRYVEAREPSILNQRLELVALRSDGSVFPVELTVTRLGTHEPPTFAGFVRDITDRRQNEEQVAELLARERRARHEAELAEQSARRISEALQRSLLPPHLPTIPGVDLGAAYEAVASGTVVGGDFYDVFPVGDQSWGIVIGDVSGKGADAASLTALIRYTLRTAAVRERDPRTVLSVVNDALLHEPRDNAYCTLIYACLNLEPRPSLWVAVAGHPLPLVVHANGTSRAVARSGTLLGAVAEPSFEGVEVALDVDETLVFYTDGVIEAGTPDGLLGVEGLQALVRRCPDRRPQVLVDCIASGVHGGVGHTVTDDIALLALRRTA